MKCDLAIGTDGDVEVTALDCGLVAGRSLLAQAIAVALRIHLGEWAFDTRAGLPWQVMLSEKPARPFSMQAKIRALVSSIEGVQRVESVLIVPDYETRAASITVEYREADSVETVTVTV